MALTNAERQKAYRERNAVTEPRNVTERNGEWDEHHIYQKCSHGMRYCLKCGTATIPTNPTPEQWSIAHRLILAGRERKAA